MAEKLLLDHYGIAGTGEQRPASRVYIRSTMKKKKEKELEERGCNLASGGYKYARIECDVIEMEVKRGKWMKAYV